MLKLSTSYSKKVPVPGQEYSSQSFHASVELELADALSPTDVQDRIHRTFLLVRDAVEAEISGKPTPQERPANPPEDKAAERTSKASNKQIKFILDLASRQGLTLAQVNGEVHRQYGAASVYDLDRKQASVLLDTLQQRKAA